MITIPEPAVRIALRFAAVDIKGGVLLFRIIEFIPVVQFQNAGVELVGYGECIAIGAGECDLVPVYGQFDPVDITRAHRHSALIYFERLDICV